MLFFYINKRKTASAKNTKISEKRHQPKIQKIPKKQNDSALRFVRQPTNMPHTCSMVSLRGANIQKIRAVFTLESEVRQRNHIHIYRWKKRRKIVNIAFLGKSTMKFGFLMLKYALFSIFVMDCFFFDFF